MYWNTLDLPTTGHTLKENLILTISTVVSYQQFSARVSISCLLPISVLGFLSLLHRPYTSSQEYCELVHATALLSQEEAIPF